MSNMILLYQQGQSMWLDSIDREMMQNGALRQLIGVGIRGGTTTNFGRLEQTIRNTHVYDDMIRDMLQADHEIDPARLYEWIAINDAKAAADLFRPVYTNSDGIDGYVSIDISPYHAYETDSIIKAARHFWKSIGRPNIMIRVPATTETLPAIERLAAEGVNIHAMSLYAAHRYADVAETYIRSVAMSLEPRSVASIASFNLSAIDKQVDALLHDMGTREALQLKGKAAIASAKLAYMQYKKRVDSPSFKRQQERGARPQRLLWNDTHPKAQVYPDMMYLNALIGPDTISAVSYSSLDSFQLRGEVKPTLEADLDQAGFVLQDLDALGINMNAVTAYLETQAVRQSIESYDALMDTLGEKMAVTAKDYATHE